MAEEKIQLESPDKQWKRLCSMLIEIESKKEILSLWIQRINAGVRSEGLTYSKFINGLIKSKIVR